MEIIIQIGVIIFFSFLGHILSIILMPFIHLPSSVIGLLLLFINLKLGYIDPEKIRPASEWLTENMGIFFVPAGVGIILLAEEMSNSGLKIIIITIFSLILLMLLTGKIMQWLLNRDKEIK